MAQAAARSPLRRLIANIGWLFASRGVGAALSIVYLAIATQSLGASGFGQFAIILSTVQAIYGIVTFNTWQIIVRYGAPHVASGDDAALERLTHMLVRLEAIAALIGFGLSCLLLTIFAARFGWSDALRWPAYIYAFVHAASFRSTTAGLLRILDRFRDAALADAILPITRFIGALALLASGWSNSVVAFLTVWALSEVTNMIALWVAVRPSHHLRAIARAGAPIRQVIGDYPGMLRFAWLTNVGSTFAAINQHVVTIAVGLFLGEIAAGFFRLGYQLGQALAKVAEVLSRATYTEFSRLRAHGDPAALAQLMRQAQRITLMVAAMIVVTLLLAGRPALLLVAGQEFLPAVPLVFLLGTAAAVDIVGTALESALLAHDGARKVLHARIAATMALIGSFALLLGPFGATGAAGAVLCASLISTGLFWLYARRINPAAP